MGNGTLTGLNALHGKNAARLSHAGDWFTTIGSGANLVVSHALLHVTCPAAPAGFPSSPPSHLALASPALLHWFRGCTGEFLCRRSSCTSQTHWSASESTAARMRVFISVSSDFAGAENGSFSAGRSTYDACGQKRQPSTGGHRNHGRIVRENPVAGQGRRRRILRLFWNCSRACSTTLEAHGARPHSRQPARFVAVLRQLARQSIAVLE